jgi:hypothetical protein
LKSSSTQSTWHVRNAARPAARLLDLAPAGRVLRQQPAVVAAIDIVVVNDQQAVAAPVVCDAEVAHATWNTA